MDEQAVTRQFGIGKDMQKTLVRLENKLLHIAR
jgi:hypothetical protein